MRSRLELLIFLAVDKSLGQGNLYDKLKESFFRKARIQNLNEYEAAESFLIEG